MCTINDHVINVEAFSRVHDNDDNDEPFLASVISSTYSEAGHLERIRAMH